METQIPILVGPARNMQDSNAIQATAVDVIFHPSLVDRAKTGTPQFSADHFRGYLVDLALKNVAEDLNYRIERFKVRNQSSVTNVFGYSTSHSQPEHAPGWSLTHPTR